MSNILGRYIHTKENKETMKKELIELLPDFCAFMRHGENDKETGLLTAEGLEAIRNNALILKEKIGHKTLVILHADCAKAFETMAQIARTMENFREPGDKNLISVSDEELLENSAWFPGVMLDELLQSSNFVLVICEPSNVNTYNESVKLDDDDFPYGSIISKDFQIGV